MIFISSYSWIVVDQGLKFRSQFLIFKLFQETMLTVLLRSQFLDYLNEGILVFVQCHVTDYVLCFFTSPFKIICWFPEPTCYLDESRIRILAVQIVIKVDES